MAERGDCLRFASALLAASRLRSRTTGVQPRTSKTDGFLSRERLALLPPRACLCNLGRGNAVDEAALAAALRGGALAGAALDVLREEPLPGDSPLRSCPNLWITPHSSAFSQGYMDLYADELAERLRLNPLQNFP